MTSLNWIVPTPPLVDAALGAHIGALSDMTTTAIIERCTALQDDDDGGPFVVRGRGRRVHAVADARVTHYRNTGSRSHMARCRGARTPPSYLGRKGRRDFRWAPAASKASGKFSCDFDIDPNPTSTSTDSTPLQTPTQGNEELRCAQKSLGQDLDANALQEDGAINATWASPRCRWRPDPQQRPRPTNGASSPTATGFMEVTQS